MIDLEKEYELGKLEYKELERKIQMEDLILEQTQSTDVGKRKALRLELDRLYYLQCRRNQLLIVKWYERWASNIHDMKQEYDAALLTKKRKELEAAEKVDACSTREIQLKHDIEIARQKFLDEEKAFHERKMAWFEFVREETRSVQKEKEEAIYALEKIQYKPIVCHVDADMLSRKVMLNCPYLPSNQSYELYSETIAKSLKEIEKIDDCLQCLQTAEGSGETTPIETS
jgi:hypothetical protein